MSVNSISYQPNFNGKIVLKNKLSSNQNYLFNLHKSALEQKIKDMPFDLFVEQSKSKKTINLSTNVKNTETLFVRKNKQNFEEIADLVILDAKKKYEAYQKLQKVNEIFNYEKYVMMNVVTGNFKAARNAEKQLAKIGTEDFDTYKSIPKMKISGVPFQVGMLVFKNSLKYRLYKLFSKKTPEEKTFLAMKKAYLKELKEQKQEIKTVEIDFPRIYQF